MLPIPPATRTEQSFNYIVGFLVLDVVADFAPPSTSPSSRANHLMSDSVLPSAQSYQLCSVCAGLASSTIRLFDVNIVKASHPKLNQPPRGVPLGRLLVRRDIH